MCWVLLRSNTGVSGTPIPSEIHKQLDRILAALDELLLCMTSVTIELREFTILAIRTSSDVLILEPI